MGTNERNLASSVAFVGIGGCGTNIAMCAENLGYNTLHINSSSQDEAALKGAEKVRHLIGFNGCAGNRKLAEAAIAENTEIIDEILNLKEEIIFVCFSVGGGTGGGIGAKLIDILCEEAEDKTFCAIVALPEKNEDLTYHTNGYECCQELLSIKTMGSVIFIDNNKNSKKALLNSSIIKMLDTFLKDNSSSKLGNVDEQEKRTMLETNGSFVISVLNGDKEKVATEDVLERLTNNNVFAPMNNDNVCEYISIINSSNDGINKNEVINVLGVPRRTFIGFGSKNTIVAASGLSFPIRRIKEMVEVARTINSQRGRREEVLLDDIDFSIDSPKVEEKKKEAEPTKKFSKRDLLKKREK